MNKKYFLLFAMWVGNFAKAQNVGIGTSTPTKGRLEVVGVAGTGATNAIFGSNSSGITLQQNYPTIGFNQYRDNTAGNGKFMATGYAAVQFMDPNSGAMVIDMLGTGTANAITGSGTRAITLLANGNVGIKSAGSPASLTVSRGTGIDGTARFEGTTNFSHFNYGFAENTYIRAGKDGSTVFVNDVNNGIIVLGNGNVKVGINKIDPTYTLEINQNNNKGILLRNSNNDDWEIFNGLPLFFKFNSVAKSFIDWDDGRYAQLSDERLKKNITAIPNIMDKIMQLKPVVYDMKTARPGKEKNIGFIAQDVRKLFPELVFLLPDSLKLGYGNLKELHMMDYCGFGVIAIKAIQEQQLVINTMLKKMEALEKQNSLLLSTKNRNTSFNKKLPLFESVL